MPQCAVGVAAAAISATVSSFAFVASTATGCIGDDFGSNRRRLFGLNANH